MPKIDVGSYYFSKDFMHAKNEVVFPTHDHLSILDRLLVDVPIDHKQKYVQFGIVYHLLMQYGCLMTNYKNLKPLLQLQK
jgi:hypothetical protein